MKKNKKEIGWIIAQRGKKGILAIDVDGYKYGDVEYYVSELQKNEDVGPALITLTSSYHYHIYFFEKFLKWSKIQKIIQNCPIADNQFKSFTKRKGFVRMRVSNLKDCKTYTIGNIQKTNFLYLLYEGWLKCGNVENQ